MTGPNLPDFFSVMARLRGSLGGRFSELFAVEQLCQQAGSMIQTRVEALVELNGLQLPITSLTIGNPETARNCLLLTGGIHGVERIGTQVLIAWLESVIERCRWDAHWQRQFDEELAIVALPIVNPGGMLQDMRCNPSSVDLNRHAPIDAEADTPFLIGGHRIWRKLPWYRGHWHRHQEIEFVALQNVVYRCTRPESLCLVVDFHSGFGFKDHLWIPYAFRKEPIEDIACYVALKLLWERNFPHHNYQFGPQAMHYLSHGDLWDYFHIQSREHGAKLLPLTLEMGSWLWVKKHPSQIFSFAGLFNPTVPHRHARVLRSHLILLDFLMAACRNPNQWLVEGEHARQLQQMAQALWYRHLPS
ncbi:DUF2817 domain-containing protein [Spongiibacter sp. KMU-158]|uniref:DUF2817 domain-containing protein n=1 Tax=Spongiibacter pelagi TaxID=2760804 RepID=A0A927GWF1_9GAMM|nr:DUF2817 domain-containing protein [Spongiibacter pelagi]MBD2858364.1 DUF2817 domain-containing protein [Spongiibacter pelagi]